MKKIILLFAIFSLISCDPEYSYLISNNSENDIFLYTEPPVKDFSIETPSESDSIFIKPKTEIRIYGSLGNGGAENSFPFEKIIIKSKNDTIILSNKTEINSKFNLKRKHSLFSTSYTIEIN